MHEYLSNTGLDIGTPEHGAKLPGECTQTPFVDGRFRRVLSGEQSDFGISGLKLRGERVLVFDDKVLFVPPQKIGGGAGGGGGNA